MKLFTYLQNKGIVCSGNIYSEHLFYRQLEYQSYLLNRKQHSNIVSCSVSMSQSINYLRDLTFVPQIDLSFVVDILYNQF